MKIAKFISFLHFLTCNFARQNPNNRNEQIYTYIIALFYTCFNHMYNEISSATLLLSSTAIIILELPLVYNFRYFWLHFSLFISK